MKEKIEYNLTNVVDKMPIAVLVEQFPIAKQLYRSNLKTYKDLVDLIKNYKENKLFLTNQGRQHIVEQYTDEDVFKAFNEVYGEKRFEEIEDYIVSDFINVNVFNGYQVLNKKALENIFCFVPDDLDTYRKTILTKERFIITNRLIGKMYKNFQNKQVESKMICQWFFKFYPNMIKDPYFVIFESNDYYSPYYFVKGLKNVLIENDENDEYTFVNKVKEYINQYVLGYKGKTKKICRDILVVRIRELDIKAQEEGLSKREKEELLFVMDSLIKQKDIDALIYKGYMYYGGGIMDCDYKVSEKCFLEAFNKYNIHTICNPLGYIYYYGRTTNGVPDYKKAFKFFSIAALAGEDEAEMKLGDLYKNGYYVKKDVSLANLIYERLFDESMVKLKKHNNTNTVLSDVAFRRALNDWDNAKTIEQYIDSMKLFYIALVAIKLKIRDKGFYFDKNVIMPNIKRNIITRYKMLEKEEIFCNKYEALKHLLMSMDEFTINIVKQDLYSITLEFSSNYNSFYFDFMHYYGIYGKTIIVNLKYDYLKMPKDIKDITTIGLNENELILRKNDKKAGIIHFNNYEILNDEPLFKKEDFDENIYHCCKAVYHEGGKEYTFLIDDDSLKVGHIAEDGQEVIITKIEDIPAIDLPFEPSKLKHIIP